MNLLNKEKCDFLFGSVKDNCINFNESTFLEFKSSFNLSNVYEYIKIFAGLSNAKGGYVIFGIEPINKELIGLKESSLEMYPKIDGEQFRGKFKNSVDPNIIYENILYTYNNNTYLVFYVHECQNKPVICSCSNTHFVEGDIFYRYNDSIKKIAQSDLSIIIDERRLKEQEKWMTFLSKIVKVGIDNLMLIDSKNGVVIEPNNNSIILDPSVIENLNLIKEGEFDEIAGKPTIKLLAEIEHKNKGINIINNEIKQAILPIDIYLDFLKETENNINAREYLTQMCEMQGLYPFFYYKKLACLDDKEFIRFIEQVKTHKKFNKQKIIEQLKSNVLKNHLKTEPEGNLEPLTNAMKNNLKYRKKILSSNINDYKTESDIEELCKSLRTLNKKEIEKIKKPLFSKFYEIINDKFKEEDIKAIPSQIKVAIKYMDEIIYR